MKKIFNFALYDFANSAFTTIIITFIFATYFAKQIASNPILSQSYWGWTIGITGFLVAIIGPIVGSFADKKNLIDEFKKITTVVKKIDSTSPHETFLILDATTGQSAISQVEEFKKITPITGIIMTKLDGTAKGGILVAIGRKFKLPIIALGMGEKEDDLQKFNSKFFSNALMHL